MCKNILSFIFICCFIVLINGNGKAQTAMQYKLTQTGLGIGLTNPSSPLHVRSSLSSLFLLDYQGTEPNFAWQQFKSQEQLWWQWAGDANANINLLNANSQALFSSSQNGSHVFNGALGINGSPDGRTLMINGGMVEIKNTASSDTENSLTGLFLSNRGVSGTSHQWALYTAAIGGGFGVNPNAFEIWQYPNFEGVDCCIARLRILPNGNTLLSPSGGYVGIATANPSVELEVAGQVKANNFITTSDQRYKKNIAPIQTAAIEKLMLLNGKTYYWDRNQYPNQNFSEKLQYGLIAQEVETFFPEIVEKDAQGKLSVNYVALVPLLLELVKTQQQELNEMKEALSHKTPRRKAIIAMQIELKNLQEQYLQLEEKISPSTVQNQK